MYRTRKKSRSSTQPNELCWRVGPFLRKTISRWHSTRPIIACWLECGSHPSYWSLKPIRVSKSQPEKLLARRTIFSTIRLGTECMCSRAKDTSKFSNRKMPTTTTGSHVTRLRRAPRPVFLFRSGESCLLPSPPRVTRVLKFECIRRTEQVSGLPKWDKQAIFDNKETK